MKWKIKKSLLRCMACEREFAEQEEYYSILEWNEEGIVRSDFCDGCFSHRPDEERRVFWRTRNREVRERKKAVNFEVLRDLFLKMNESGEEIFQEITYLLGLILIRKRLLILKDFISEEGKDFMTVRRKRGEPLIRVEVPFLNESDIASLRDRLSDLLDADLDGSLDVKELKERVSALGKREEEEDRVEPDAVDRVESDRTFGSEDAIDPESKPRIEEPADSFGEEGKTPAAPFQKAESPESKREDLAEEAPA